MFELENIPEVPEQVNCKTARPAAVEVVKYMLPLPPEPANARKPVV
jgi:hypothetical protein